MLLLWLKRNIQDRKNQRYRQSEMVVGKHFIRYQKCCSVFDFVKLFQNFSFIRVNNRVILCKGKKSNVSKFFFVIGMGWEWILHQGNRFIGSLGELKFFIWFRYGTVGKISFLFYLHFTFITSFIKYVEILSWEDTKYPRTLTLWYTLVIWFQIYTGCGYQDAVWAELTHTPNP